MGCAIAAQMPAVQTMMAKKAMKILSEKINGEVLLGSVHISPSEGIAIKDVLILDNDAYLSEGDTLLRAKSVTATFSPKGLLSKTGIKIRRVRIADAHFFMASEPLTDSTGTSNLKRIFNMGPSDKKKEVGDKEMFHIDEVLISDAGFRMKNYKKPKKARKPPIPDAINWRDFDAYAICLNARNVSMRAGYIYADVDKLSAREKSGLDFEKVSGKVKAGHGVIDVRNLAIKDDFSDIHMSEFTMTNRVPKAFKHFLQDVRMDADINESLVDSRTISFFARALKKMDFTLMLDGGYHGYVSDFEVEDLKFDTVGDELKGTIDGRLTGIPKSLGMMTDAKITDLSCTTSELTAFIKSFAPSMNMDLGKFAPGQRFTLNGTARGPLNRLMADMKGNSDIGDFHTELDLRNTIDKARTIQIAGNLVTSSLDIGKIIGKDDLGACTMVTRLGAVLEKGAPQITVDTLMIDKLRAHGYTYSSISGSGKYLKDGFEGRIVSNDPNLTFIGDVVHNKPTDKEDGAYQLRIDLSRAGLDTLNFYKHGASKVSLYADGFFNEGKNGSLNGDIQINDIMLQDENGLHNVGNILLAAIMDEGMNAITVNSAVVDGQFYGSGSIGQFIKDFSNIALKKEVPALFGNSTAEWSGNRYDLDLSIHDSHDLLSFFIPGLYVADSTAAKVSIGESGSLNGRIQSQRLAFKDKYLKDVRIKIDNNDHNINVDIEADELSASPVLMKSDRIFAYAHDNNLGLGITYDNETELENKGEIFLTCHFDKNKNGLIAHGSVIPSNIYLNSTAWSINPAEIDFEGGTLSIRDLLLSSDNQSIGISGGYSKTMSDSLTIRLNQFDISALNPMTRDRFGLGGLASGSATLRSPMKDGLALLANIRVADAMISGKNAGTMVLGSSWDEENKGFNITLRNSLDNNLALSANALFIPSRKTMDARIGLNAFDLSYAEPFLKGVFSEMGGQLYGTVRASGPLDWLDISSSGLRISDGLMRVDFTNVPYKVEGPVHIDGSGVWFDDDTLTDRFGAHGTVSGGIRWDHLKDMRFQTDVRFTDMEVLDLPENSGQQFYGNAFGSGNVRISGPMNAMHLEVNASTSKEGEFHLPMSGSASAKSSDLLTFKTPQEEYIMDPYEVMMGMYMNKEKKAGSDMSIALKLNVDQGTEAFVEIDKSSGNILTGRGNGNIEIEVRPKRDVFTMNGNYDITGGNYHLDVLGIAQKDFDIQEGSNVRFSGNIMDSDLDINAIYKTKASVGTLIADSTSTARRTVECGISISDKIRNPQIGFSISVPDLDPTTQAMVENALNTDDKVQKQFLSLLISGSFLPDEQSGIVNNSSMLNTTVTEIMAGQLNNILQKLDIPVDLGLDFQQGQGGKSVYDVAISTELFNNRVVVNGTIGNRQYNTAGTNSDEFVGDLDIEIKMDQTGALRFNLFSHSADQYTSYLDDSQRNGAGITYQREFNSFREFIRDLFRSKEERKAAEVARQQAQIGGERTVIKIED